MNSNEIVYRRRWPWFITGFVISLIVTITAIRISAYVRRLGAWGMPQVTSDNAVRARLDGRGVLLPESAHHLYHAIAGFVDHEEYIAFSAPYNDCMSSAMKYARRQTNEPIFSKGTKSEYEFINEGPAHWGTEWATPLWDIHNVKSGLVFEERHVFVMVDTDSNRVFISTWSE